MDGLLGRIQRTCDRDDLRISAPAIRRRARDRDPRGWSGDRRATRASASAPWGAGSAVPGAANVGSEEAPGWVSPDGCDLYFYDNGSDLPGAQGADDLYEMVRPASAQ